MDPITLVVTALAAGAAGGLQDVASETVTRIYASLRERVLSHFKDEPDAEVVVRRFDEDPETWTAPLEQALRSSRIAEDAELIQAARDLLSQVDPAGTAAGTYTVTNNAPTQGQVVGQGNHVTQSFNGGVPNPKAP